MTVGDKTIVSYGPWGLPVNEPSAAAIKEGQGNSKVVCLWNVQDVPGQGQVEVPLLIGYAVSHDAGDTWTEQGFLPAPSGSDAEASAVVSGVLENTPYPFMAAAISFELNVPTAYIARMQPEQDTFDPIATFDDFDTCEANYATFSRAIGLGGASPLLTHVPFGGGGCGANDQIALRDLAAGTYDPIEVNGVDVLGVPSEPAVLPISNTAYFAHSRIEGDQFVRSVAWDTQAGDPADTGLDQARNLVVGQNETYFDVANGEVAGQFEIGPFTSVAASRSGGEDHIYIVYADTVDDTPLDDDFNIYFIHGVKDSNGVYTWSNPVRVNGGPDGGEFDQFMPAIAVTDQRLHVVWYDTRHAFQSSSSAEVMLSVYYAYSDDDGTNWNEVLIDQEAVVSGYLDNPVYIGDHIDVTPLTANNSVLITYMGTRHSLAGGFGIHSPHPQFDTNEAIFSVRIEPGN